MSRGRRYRSHPLQTPPPPPPPAGYQAIASALEQFNTLPANVTPTPRSLRRLNHDHTHYLSTQRASMSPELWAWIRQMGYVDEMLLARWEQKGYEKLCCEGCALTAGGIERTCICRIPKTRLKEEWRNRVCADCGCAGCAGDEEELSAWRDGMPEKIRWWLCETGEEEEVIRKEEDNSEEKMRRGEAKESVAVNQENSKQ